MNKVIINVCFGGFGLSDLAYEELNKLGIPIKKYTEGKEKVIFDRTLGDEKEQKDIEFLGRYWETWLEEDRENELLIKVIEKLGGKANCSCADLKIVEIPDNVEYEIEEYDGAEHIAEAHRTWN